MTINAFPALPEVQPIHGFIKCLTGGGLVDWTFFISKSVDWNTKSAGHFDGRRQFVVAWLVSMPDLGSVAPCKLKSQSYDLRSTPSIKGVLETVGYAPSTTLMHETCNKRILAKDVEAYNPAWGIQHKTYGGN